MTQQDNFITNYAKQQDQTYKKEVYKVRRDIIVPIKQPSEDHTLVRILSEDFKDHQFMIPGERLTRSSMPSHLYLHTFSKNQTIEYAYLDSSPHFAFIYRGELPNILNQNPVHGKEESMFDSMKIVEVELRQVDPVAIENAVKKLTEKRPEIESTVQDGRCYLIQGGRSVEITGEELTNRLREQIVGKTVSQFKSNTLLNDLISELGLLKSIKLDSNDEDILSSVLSDVLK